MLTLCGFGPAGICTFGSHLGTNPEAEPISPLMDPDSLHQCSLLAPLPRKLCHSLTQSFVNPTELTNGVASVSNPDAADADATDSDDDDDATNIIDYKNSSKFTDTDGDDDSSDVSMDTPDGSDSSSKSMDINNSNEFSSESKDTDSDDHPSSEPINSDTEEEDHNHPLPNVIGASGQEPTEPNASGTGNNNGKSSSTSTSNCQNYALLVLSTSRTRITNTKPAETIKLKPGRKTVTKCPAIFTCLVHDCPEESYTMRYNLESHMSSRHGDYAYQCDFCIKVYAQYGD
ncbi:hypothetical protein BG015_004504, partial [Linnemannia schmuckeri]